MAYRCDPPDIPSVEEILKERRGRKIDIEITPRTRQGECNKSILYLSLTKLMRSFSIVMREIEERREFLDEMRQLGTSHFVQVEALVRAEIANKTDELERLRIHQQPSDDYEDEDAD